jgi:hypothetical protein
MGEMADYLLEQADADVDGVLEAPRKTGGCNSGQELFYKGAQMNEIKGLSSDPAEAYQQGRRDGAADAFQAVELAETSHNTARKEILLCSYTGFCLANQHGICTDACFCNCQRKTSSVGRNTLPTILKGGRHES